MLQMALREAKKVRQSTKQTLDPVDPREGYRLVRAFISIKSQQQRERILKQVEALARNP